MACLESRDLDVRIAGMSICRNLDLHISTGEFWGILGTNGVGKTTLLHTLSGLRPAVDGEVLLNGDPLAGIDRPLLARQLGVVFQHDEDPFPGTVMEAVLVGRHPYLRTWEWEGPRDREIARAALESMDLSGMEGRTLATLSGGERRRLSIATLLAQKTDFMLLDEPTGHLDIRHQVRMLEHMSTLTRNKNRAVLMVLHDVNLALRFCGRVLLLFGDGETSQGATQELLDEDTLTRLYGHSITSYRSASRIAYLPG